MISTLNKTEIKDVVIRGAIKRFGSNLVLNEIDLEVKQGELITLLGPSGCGKTTTLNVIAGFIELDKGEVYIKDKLMNGIPTYKRDLGMVFQSYSLFPHMTIYQNLDFGLSFHKISKNEKKQRIQEALELVKMSGLDKRYPRELSGGQRQRVAIARALVVQPKLLLLDEPLSNLDAKLRHELRSEIKRLQKELGVTTIFVTHDQEEALSMSDRIVVMNNGRIEQIGTPTEIYQNPATEFVYQFIGKSNCIRGIITTVSQDKIHVNLQDEWQVTIDRENLLNPSEVYEVGNQVNLYIRPEKIKVINDKQSTETKNIHTVKIKQLNYLGSYWEMEVDLLGNLLQVTTSIINESWAIGSEVNIGWNQSDVLIIKV